MNALTVPLTTAGAVMGLASEAAAYEHVNKHLQVITLGQRKQVVLASQLANLLKVDLPTLWATIDDINARDKAAAPERAAKRAAEKAAADKRTAELIQRRVDNDPVVVQAVKTGRVMT